MTDSERLLEALSDGREHDHRSLYFGLNVMVHSRAADLRKRGHDIRVRREGDLYLYRLAALGEPEPRAPSLIEPGGGASALFEAGRSGSPSAPKSAGADMASRAYPPKVAPDSLSAPAEQLVLT